MTSPRFVVGDPVEVHTRFNGSWSAGFEIAVVLPGGYRVRRMHDGMVLPETTGDDDVRSARAVSPWA